MSDGEKEQRHRSPLAGCLTAALLFAFLAYPLSWGPAAWLNRHGYLPNEAGVIYMPLAWLANHCKPISDALEWYIGLWI